MRPFYTIRILVFLSVSLGLHPGGLARWEAALAESSDGRAIELVARASKAYEAGAYTDATASLDAAFKAGLTGQLAARAILLRAQINERSGALAHALQDYSNALWMESLPVPQRKEATEGKARVMAAMGLNGSTPGSTKPVSVQGGSGEGSSGVFGMFNGLFGSSKPATAPPAEPQKNWQTATAPQPAPAEAPQKKVAASAPAKPAAAPKAANAEKTPAPKATVARNASLEPTTASSVASKSDGFLIVFGSANSQAAGQSMAQKIKAQLSDILINRNLDVEAGPSGGFQIVAGPYKAKSAANALCSAMKQRGVQCQVTP